MPLFTGAPAPASAPSSAPAPVAETHPIDQKAIDAYKAGGMTLGEARLQALKDKNDADTKGISTNPWSMTNLWGGVKEAVTHPIKGIKQWAQEGASKYEQEQKVAALQAPLTPEATAPGGVLREKYGFQGVGQEEINQQRARQQFEEAKKMGLFFPPGKDQEVIDSLAGAIAQEDKEGRLLTAARILTTYAMPSTGVGLGSTFTKVERALQNEKKLVTVVEDIPKPPPPPPTPKVKMPKVKPPTFDEFLATETVIPETKVPKVVKPKTPAVKPPTFDEFLTTEAKMPIPRPVPAPSTKVPTFAGFMEEGAKLPKKAPKIPVIEQGSPSKVFVPETKISTVARKVSETKIAKTLGDSFGDLPSYKTINFEDQARTANDLIRNDFARARRIALGMEKPTDVLPESVYVALEKHAKDIRDPELIRELATSSTLPREASEMGQRIATLGEREPNSPVSAVRRIVDARKESVVRRTGQDVEKAKVTIQKVVRNNIEASVPKKYDWQNLIKEITC